MLVTQTSRTIRISKTSLKVQTILSLILNALGILLLFLQQIVFARILDSSLFGQYSFIASIFAITGIFTNWGMGTLSSKEIPTINKIQLLKGFYKFSLNTVFIFNIIGGIILVLFFVFYNKYIEFTYQYSLIILATIYFLFKSIFELISLQFQAEGHTIVSKLTSLIILPFISIAGSISYFLITGYINSLEFFFILLNVCAFISALLVFIIKKPKLYSLNNIQPEYEVKKWLKKGANLMVLAGLYVLLGKVNVVILGFFAKPEEVGYYSVALALAGLVLFGIQGVNQIIGPVLAKEFSIGNMKRFEDLLRKAMKLGLLFTSLGILILCFLGEFILSMYGHEFIDAHPILIILSLSHLITAISGPVGLSCTMTGRENFVLISAAIAALVNIILAFILVQDYGMIGVAVGNSIGIILLNFPLAIYARIRFGYNTMLI